MATYTKKQILEIDATRRALVDVFYDCDNGEVYIGLASGKLLQYQLSQENFIESPAVVANTTKGAIEELSAKENINTKNINDDYVKSFLLMGG
jgi:hypothetical protein